MHRIFNMEELEHFPASRTLADFASNASKERMKASSANANGKGNLFQSVDQTNYCHIDDNQSFELLDGENPSPSFERKRAASFTYGRTSCRRPNSNVFLSIPNVVHKSEMVHYPFRSPRKKLPELVPLVQTIGLNSEADNKGEEGGQLSFGFNKMALPEIALSGKHLMKACSGDVNGKPNICLHQSPDQTINRQSDENQSIQFVDGGMPPYERRRAASFTYGSISCRSPNSKVFLSVPKVANKSDLDNYPFRSPKKKRSELASLVQTIGLSNETDNKGKRGLEGDSKRCSSFLSGDNKKVSDLRASGLGLPNRHGSYPVDFYQLPGSNHPLFTPPRPAHDNHWSSTPKSASSSHGMFHQARRSEALDLSATSPIRVEQDISSTLAEPYDLSIHSPFKYERASGKVLDLSLNSNAILGDTALSEMNESNLDFFVDDTVHPSQEYETGERIENDKKCTYCSRLFRPMDSLVSYEMHLYRHTRTRPYSCVKCQNATFPARYYMQKHHSLPHSLLGFRDFETYSCSSCLVVFQTMEEYDLHLDFCLNTPDAFPEKAQRRNKGNECRKVNDEDASVSEAPLAIEELLEENSFMPFSIVNAKKRQKTQHHCEFCAKALASKSALARHVAQIHHGGNQGHPCPICCKEFSSQYNMKIHQRIHTGDKPYPCDICGEKFRVKCTMQSHKHRAHKLVLGDTLSPDETSSPQHESGFAEAVKVGETSSYLNLPEALLEDNGEKTTTLSETRASSDDTGVNFNIEERSISSVLMLRDEDLEHSLGVLATRYCDNPAPGSPSKKA